MKAGSAVYYLGSTVHGGGANNTESEARRGMFYGYVVGWLRTAENMFLTVPIDDVRNMPTRVQSCSAGSHSEGLASPTSAAP